MGLRLGDLAPNFVAETSEGRIEFFMSIWVIVGEFYFPTRQIIPLYAPQNLVRLLSSGVSLKREIRK